MKPTLGTPIAAIKSFIWAIVWMNGNFPADQDVFGPTYSRPSRRAWSASTFATVRRRSACRRKFASYGIEPWLGLSHVPTRVTPARWSPRAKSDKRFSESWKTVSVLRKSTGSPAAAHASFWPSFPPAVRRVRRPATRPGNRPPARPLQSQIARPIRWPRGVALTPIAPQPRAMVNLRFRGASAARRAEPCRDGQPHTAGAGQTHKTSATYLIRAHTDAPLDNANRANPARNSTRVPGLRHARRSRLGDEGMPARRLDALRQRTMTRRGRIAACTDRWDIQTTAMTYPLQPPTPSWSRWSIHTRPGRPAMLDVRVNVKLVDRQS